MNIIKKIVRKVILSCCPEVFMLNNKHLKTLGTDYMAAQNITWDPITDLAFESIVDRTSKLYSPYNIRKISIGAYSYIAKNAIISNTTIGKFCSIGPNFVCGWGVHPTETISTHPMFYSTLKQNGMTLSATNKIEERKPIEIGNDVFIGANVTVLDGVTIGDGAVIGAGAVVSKDIPPYAVAVGCPIKITRYRFDDNTRKKIQDIKWWDFEGEELQDVERMIFDVEAFVNKYGKS